MEEHRASPYHGEMSPALPAVRAGQTHGRDIETYDNFLPLAACAGGILPMASPPGRAQPRPPRGAWEYGPALSLKKIAPLPAARWPGLIWPGNEKLKKPAVAIGYVYYIVRCFWPFRPAVWDSCARTSDAEICRSRPSACPVSARGTRLAGYLRGGAVVARCWLMRIPIRPAGSCRFGEAALAKLPCPPTACRRAGYLLPARRDLSRPGKCGIPNTKNVF